jgi:Ca2+/H+ antiporter
MILIIVLIFLILLYIVRISNNKDIIKENSKDQITDNANIKNARKHFANKKTFKYLLLLTILLTIVFLISDFTSIEAEVIDYFALDFYQEQEFNRILYLIPIYIIVVRNIILEVKMGEFLFKYYKVDEPVLDESLLKIMSEQLPKVVIKKK